MELKPDHWQSFMFNRHHGLVSRFRGDGQAIWDGFGLADQRVVASCLERRLHLVEHRRTGMFDLTAASVHRFIGSDDLAAEGLDDRLVPQADAQDWFCLLYTSPSPRDQRGSRMPSSA